MKKIHWYPLIVLALALIFFLAGVKPPAQNAVIPEPVMIETVIYKYYDNATVQYIYTPFPESWEIADNTTLAEFPLSLEQTIKSSLDGAYAHLYWYKQGVDKDHNLYWWNVHKSAAYWLEESGRD